MIFIASIAMNKFIPYNLTIKGRETLISRPLVMGILNVTPDSFYGDSRCDAESKIIQRVEQLITNRADIIDIGGYSSRPGAQDVSPDEEYSRLAMALRIIRGISHDIIVSVDTFRADVAKRCVLDWGADIINDISGGTLDSEMFHTVAQLHTPYVLMHMRGNPATMSQLTQYNNVTTDVIADLSTKVNELQNLGVSDIIIDPGFGFGKTTAQNFEMLAHLDSFHSLGKPILVGVSRKSMIYKTLQCSPETALNGTTILNTIALSQGAHILRVHDVREAAEAITLTETTFNPQ